MKTLLLIPEILHSGQALEEPNFGSSGERDDLSRFTSAARSVLLASHRAMEKDLSTSLKGSSNSGQLPALSTEETELQNASEEIRKKDEIASRCSKEGLTILSLPPEIGNMIWSLSTTFDNTIVRIPRHGADQLRLALPCCNKQIELECGNLLYENNDIRLDFLGSPNLGAMTEKDKSEMLCLPLRYFSSLRSLVLEVDSKHWLSHEGTEMMISIRDRATSVEKITITIISDLWDFDVKAPEYIDEVADSFEYDLSKKFYLFFQLFRFEKRMFKVLRSFPSLQLLEISLGASYAKKKWNLNGRASGTQTLYEVVKRGLGKMRGQCFSRIKRLACGPSSGHYLSDRKTDCGEDWRWIIELEAKAAPKRNKIIFPTFDEILAAANTPSHSCKF